VSIAVDDVALEESHGRWRIALTITADDGTSTRLLHLLPLDAMEWRAAEYGIDPADTATLLDIVIAEPHLTREDWASGTTLHDAPDIDTARRDHLARCAVVKLRHRLSTRGMTSPLAKVRLGSLMDRDTIAVKAEFVATVRESKVAEDRRRASSTSRAEALRRRLFPRELPRTEPRPVLGEES
jgi:hypothetical protein